MIDLGDRVKDRLSEYTGTVTSRTAFLNGCARVGVTSGLLDKDGKPMDAHVFDENQLELLERHAVSTDNRVERVAAEKLDMVPRTAASTQERPEPVRRTGGPRPDVGRPPDVTR